MIAADLLFLTVFLVVFPMLTVRAFPVAMRTIVSGRPGVRESQYRQTVIRQWALAALGAAIWLAGGRSLAALGLRMADGWGFWAALAFAAVGAAALHNRVVVARRSEEARGEIRAQLGGTLVFLPRTPGEARTFVLMALTAGICEELLYRGWVIGWLAPRLGMPAAFVLSVVAFGAAHAYGGRTVALRAGATGLVLAALFVLSGSLWVPMALHAFIDLNAGQLSRTAYGDAPTREVAA